MNAKYSTSGSDTWIVDVMENDSVMTSAEAESQEEAMAIARYSCERVLREQGSHVRVRRLSAVAPNKETEVGECDQILIAASGEETGQV